MEVFDEASSKARQLEEQAGQQAEQGQFEAAILLYLAAAKVHPQDGKLFEQLSQCYTESEQYEEAYAAAAQAVQLAPEVNRCGLNSGHVSEAVHHYSQYMVHCPDDEVIYQELTSAQQLEEQYVAVQIGIPNLRIHQQTGREAGPGSIVWEAGVILSQFLVSNAALVHGKRVLELGCGTGVVGLTAACLGAQAVLTDRSSTIVQTQRTIEDNQALLEAAGGSAMAAVLEWGAEGPLQPQVEQKLDVIVGADLIYARRDIAPLAATLDQVLQQSPICNVIIAHKHRQDGISRELFDHLQQLGLSMLPLHVDNAITVYQGRWQTSIHH